MELIGYSAFRGCNNLAEIVLPESIPYIREDSFADCPQLEVIKIRNSDPAKVYSALGNLILSFERIRLFVPAGAGYAFRHHPFFAQFSEIIPKLR